MTLNTKESRFLRHYADVKNPSAAQKQTYMTLQAKQDNPTFANNKDERYFRQTNPLHNYTKGVEMRYINQITNNLKNNAGVSQPQMNQYQDLMQKWNYNPNKIDQEEMFKKMLGEQQSYVNNMYNAQRDSQLSALRAQRDKAVGQINQQKAETKPVFQQKRNQADVVNQQNVQKLRELMAANGLSATGENVSANVTANNERLNSINALNQQEQQVMNDFDRRITDINNPAQEQSIIAAIEAQRSQALASAYENAMNESYDRYRDTIGDQRYGQEFEYQKGRDARRDAEWESQQKADRAWREYTFNNMSASEKAQLKWAQEQFGEELGWQYYAKKMELASQEGIAQAELDFYNSGFNNVQGGGGYSNNYKTQQQASKSGTFNNFQTHMNQAVQMGVPSGWVPALTELVGRESSWNPSAKNPNSTAHGYGQFLNSTRSNYEKKTGLNYGNPVHQLVMMAQYVKDRYGTPEKALAFWDKNKWY